MNSTEKKPAARKRIASPAGTTPRTAAGRRSTRAIGTEPAHHEIERRAYEIFLRDGRHGRALEHWLQAERELRRP